MAGQRLRLSHRDSDLACTAPGRRWWRTARRTPGGRRCRHDPVGGQQEERRRERWREHRSGRSSCPHVTRRTAMSHTLMSLDAEWRRLARASRARRALKQWSIAHPALRGMADLDRLLERRRDDQAAPRSSVPWPCSPPATIWPLGPCCRRCCRDWSAWPGWSATTTRPRSRRWCRWPGNASAPTRPGAGVGGGQRLVRRAQALPRPPAYRGAPIARCRGSRRRAWSRAGAVVGPELRHPSVARPTDAGLL